MAFVFRKPTWTGLYLNFTSFCPLQYKRTLVHTVYHRATQIRTPDRIAEELDSLKTVLESNNYPDQFIMKHLTTKPKGDKITTVPKKTVFLQMPYTGETVFTSVKRWRPFHPYTAPVRIPSSLVRWLFCLLSVWSWGASWWNRKETK